MHLSCISCEKWHWLHLTSLSTYIRVDVCHIIMKQAVSTLFKYLVHFEKSTILNVIWVHQLTLFYILFGVNPVWTRHNILEQVIPVFLVFIMWSILLIIIKHIDRESLLSECHIVLSINRDWYGFDIYTCLVFVNKLTLTEILNMEKLNYTQLEKNSEKS